MQIEILKVRGISGEGCADKVSAILKTIDGVNDVTVSLAFRNATVQFDEQRTSMQELQENLANAGYGIEAITHVNPAATSCCGGCGGRG